MYITAVPKRHSPPAILLRESFRDGAKVRTRTLANLTSWAPERIEALRRALKGEFDGLTGDLQPVLWPHLCCALCPQATRRARRTAPRAGDRALGQTRLISGPGTRGRTRVAPLSRAVGGP